MEEAPPPPPQPPGSPSAGGWATLPPGWSTAISAQDGRIYYYEASTGRSSWAHPLAAPTSTMTTASGLDYIPFEQNPPPRRWNWFSRRPQNYSYETELNHYSNTDINHDTPRNATRRPDNHQCYAMAALVLCFPIGLCALYQSYMVDKSWSQGYYGDAVNHSRQASQYACSGCAIGVCLWIYIFLFDELLRMRDWFRFD